jgi:uncharacterized membrane protein
VSDSPQGPGWWQASDGKWYPPEQAPGGGASAGGAGGGGAAAFSVGDALSYGWNKFVQYIGQIIVIVLIIFAIQLVLNILSQALQAGSDSFFVGITLGFALTAVSIFVSFLLQAGLIRAALAITRGEAPEPSMLFQTDRLGPYAVASIVVALLIFVGLLLCCIPGLIVAFFTYFFGFYVIDRGVDPIESIKSSVSLVQENFGNVLLLMIVVVLLNLVTCGLASGVTFIALGYAYKTLNGEAVAA